MDKRIWCVAVVAIGLSLAGCSKSKDTGPTGDTAGTGGTDMSTGGTGGTTMGTGGTTMGTGGMTGAVVMNVPCGDTMCAGAVAGSMMGGFGPMFAQVCCADETTSTCGTISTSTMQCQAPPPVDNRCPSAFGGIAAPCCTADNLCGISGALQGGGCIDLGTIKMMFGNFGGGGGAFTIPDPMHCDGTPIENMDMDAGM